MTRIDSGITANTMLEWVQRNQDQITTHPAWYRSISENEAEGLLKDKKPFTYVLSSRDKEHSYFISFVQEDGSIKHKSFVLELDKKGWYYRNGSTSKYPEGVVSKDLNEIISLMIQGEADSCIHITNKNATLR